MKEEKGQHSARAPQVIQRTQDAAGVKVCHVCHWYRLRPLCQREAAAVYGRYNDYRVNEQF